jgi:hypothetical protein
VKYEIKPLAWIDGGNDVWVATTIVGAYIVYPDDDGRMIACQGDQKWPVKSVANGKERCWDNYMLKMSSALKVVK